LDFNICKSLFTLNCLFQDIEGKQKAVSDMQRVIDEPAMGQSDLDQLNHQVCTV
jgi:hypothetical protein